MTYGMSASILGVADTVKDSTTTDLIIVTNDIVAMHKFLDSVNIKTNSLWFQIV